MSNWHGYIGFLRSTTNLTMQNWIAIGAILDQLQGTNDNASTLLQRRLRNDNNAAIYEANFYNDEITLQRFKNVLVNRFGVNPNRITYSTSIIHLFNHDSVMVIYRFDGLVMLTIVLFGRDSDVQNSTWEESRDECNAYLIANQSEWNE